MTQETQELDFKISSGLKNIIGKELITNDLIAIFELVKNSYDANAKSVRLVFQNIKEEHKQKVPKILILDDGDGMSYDDIINKWLFVGFSEKKYLEKGLEIKDTDFRNKVQKRRFLAGAKGVGRFSCDRLGSELKLFTKKEKEEFIHCLYMDWNKFEEDPKKEFQKVKVNYSTTDRIKIEGYDVKDFKKGTILEISSLNDNWDWKKLIKLKRYLQRLINPSQVGEIQEFEIYLEAMEYLEEDRDNQGKGEFNKIINGVVKNIIFEKLGIKTTQINCDIDEKGEKIYTELIDKSKFIFKLEEKNEYPFLRNINVKLFYLNPDAKNAFTRIMGTHAVNYGSIFLYKNKFRIHPYGDEGNDWLELEKRKGQGYARFLATRELMGRIEINGYQPDFIEVSSRDGGIIKTQGYQQLTSFFMEKVLRRFEKYVVEGIDWDNPEHPEKTPEKLKEDSLRLIEKIVGRVKDPEKKIQFNDDLLEIFKEKQVEKIPELIKNVESLKKYVPPPQKEYIDTQLKAFRNATKTLEKGKRETEEELEATKKTSLFLSKAVSTDKEILINLNHSIKITTFNIEKTIEEINQRIKDGKSIADILPLVDEIKLENQKIRILSSYVSFATFDTKVESIKKDMVLFIKEYLGKILANREKSLKIRFLNDNIVFSRRFKPLEMSIMLDNLIDNSRKAGASSLTVKFENTNKDFHLYISDNGKGINTVAEKYIFNRGYTTTDGSGIGLYHVRKILESSGSNIKFIGNNVKGLETGACFEVVFK